MPNAVITGGTKGIGLAIVQKLASEGFNVAFCARNTDEVTLLAKTLSETFISQKFYGFVCDVSELDSLNQFFKTVDSVFKSVDLLVNNAGVFIPGQISTEPAGVFETQMNTNLRSVYYTCRYFVTEMKAKKAGHIINICSTASNTAYVNGGSYCISKFAVLGLTKVLREELKSFNIRITAILPGATLTESWSGTDLPKDRFIDPSAIADAVYAAWTLPPNVVVEEITIRPMAGDIT